MTLKLVGPFTSHLYIIFHIINLSCIWVTEEFHNIPASDSQNLYDSEGRLPRHLFISSSHWTFRVISSDLTKKLIKLRTPFSKDLPTRPCLLWSIGSWALWRMLTTERGWSEACWLRTHLSRLGVGSTGYKLWENWRENLRSAMWKKYTAKHSKSKIRKNFRKPKTRNDIQVLW